MSTNNWRTTTTYDDEKRRIKTRVNNQVSDIRPPPLSFFHRSRCHWTRDNDGWRQQQTCHVIQTVTTHVVVVSSLQVSNNIHPPPFFFHTRCRATSCQRHGNHTTRKKTIAANDERPQPQTMTHNDNNRSESPPSHLFPCPPTNIPPPLDKGQMPQPHHPSPVTTDHYHDHDNQPRQTKQQPRHGETRP
ncbi:hypothetical protein K443DRAFT_256264 [Laccaria amethystina LaAM-08-1]|uniref:Unplaced genomic scaffold K443scaffold_163, whole genome shotgun sequence n=1 Tax=Laccaria amethystina LaAM-08-1 TaxID=1095629 RepID=A0A0C9XMG3_9AGAR|nr:hypothetical protein K443DRAFT_256264 [Laccaria amethystina LaAM-08-1]